MGGLIDAGAQGWPAVRRAVCPDNALRPPGQHTGYLLICKDATRELPVARAEARFQALLESAPDAMVIVNVDVQLPDMDGFEIARWLKSHPVLRRIPLVAVTAFAMLGDRERVLAAGFDGYLAKPIQPETFVQRMEAFLPLEKHSAAISPTTTEVTVPESAANTPGPTILVVDNLPLNIELARCILEPSGYRPVTATSMAEGLRMARETLCDLILSDVCMGGAAGMIPFVLITSTMIGDGDHVKGLALGAERFLRRPIEPEALLGGDSGLPGKKRTD